MAVCNQPPSPLELLSLCITIVRTLGFATTRFESCDRKKDSENAGENGDVAGLGCERKICFCWIACLLACLLHPRDLPCCLEPRHCVKLLCLRGFTLKQVSEDAEPRARCTKGIGKALCSLQNRCSMVHQQTSANGFMVQWSEKVLNYVWIRSILFNGGWMDNFTAICDEKKKTRQSPSKSGEEKGGRESRVQKPHATLKLYNTADLQTNKTGTRLALGSG